jgi:hypothetical protein
MVWWLAAWAAFAAPSGYVVDQQGRGVTLWRQDVSGGEPDWVLEVDLNVARVDSLVDPTGGALWRHTNPTWWTRGADANLFAVVNGAFFNPGIDPTEPAFGLRVPTYRHAGYGTASEFTDQQLALWFEDGRVNLYGHVPANLDTGAEHQVVALSPYANKSASSWVARTFAGVKDFDGVGHRTLLFFVTRLANQQYAREELARWGTTNVIMLDGGGSTQLRVRGVDQVATSRGVPHVFRVLEGPAPETCNGRDDDGDGTIDEGFPDADNDGTKDCVDVETCDGVDNDGDGAVDEGFPDTDLDGTKDCVDVETCDGVDNNGNGSTDEGFPDTDLDGTRDCVDPTPNGEPDDTDTDTGTDSDSDPDSDSDSGDTDVPDTDSDPETDSDSDSDDTDSEGPDTDSGDPVDVGPRRCACDQGGGVGFLGVLPWLALRRRRVSGRR